MATATAIVSMTRPIPMRILAFAMRLETTHFFIELTPVLDSISHLRDDVSGLMKRYDILSERVERTQNRILELISDIQPVWNDTYNLCGDSACEGDCMVCRDGEYIEEDEYEEKYCRRGKR